MRIQSKLAGREGGSSCNVLPMGSTKTSSKSKRPCRRQKKMSQIQKLYETCKEVFASGGPGIVPSQEDIEKLTLILDSMKPEDLDLTPNMPYFRKSIAPRNPPITYLHLYECDQFSIGIFCLPPSGVIPLHNHPGMTVFSKLLFGTMNIKAYDWVVDRPPQSIPMATPSGDQSSEIRLAKVKVNTAFKAPCDTSILYPADGGNMHCFTALTACAVLDVLGPPYSDPDGRHCTYYLDYPYPKFSVDASVPAPVPEEEKEGYAWLQERDKPENFTVVGALYSGPKIFH